MSGKLRRGWAAAWVAAMFGGANLAPLAPAQQAHSDDYTLSEWTLVQGARQELGSPTVQAVITLAPAHGNQSHARTSGDYVASFNFLTDEFGVAIGDPDAPFFRSLVNTTTVTLAWKPSPDEGSALFDGYRVKILASPQASQPLMEFETPNPSLKIEGVVSGVKLYATVETFWRRVSSSPTVTIQFVTTENRARGDVDGNGLTDGRDLVDALFAVNSRALPGHSAAADLDVDGVVDGGDLDRIVAQIGWIE